MTHPTNSDSSAHWRAAISNTYLINALLAPLKVSPHLPYQVLSLGWSRKDKTVTTAMVPHQDVTLAVSAFLPWASSSVHSHITARLPSPSHTQAEETTEPTTSTTSEESLKCGFNWAVLIWTQSRHLNGTRHTSVPFPKCLSLLSAFT